MKPTFEELKKKIDARNQENMRIKFAHTLGICPECSGRLDPHFGFQRHKCTECNYNVTVNSCTDLPIDYTGSYKLL